LEPWWTGGATAVFNDALDPGGQVPDALRVDPELVDQRPRLRQQDHPDREAEQRQRQPEREGGHRHPGLAQRGREVVVLRGVVDDVARPEDTALVRDPVKPVVREVVGEEEREPGQRVAGVQPQRRQLVQRGVDRDDHELPADVDHGVAQAHGQRRAGVAQVVAEQLVVVVVQVPERRVLGDEQQDEEGDRVVEDLAHRALPGIERSSRSRAAAWARRPRRRRSRRTSSADRGTSASSPATASGSHGRDPLARDERRQREAVGDVVGPSTTRSQSTS
jgi:hypothetical protein